MWNDSDDPWTGDWQHSTIIVDGDGTDSGYMCYDIDSTDHQAKCTGSAQCTGAFEGKPEADQIADNCPSGCTFTAKVKAVKVVDPHAPAIEMPGYIVKSGACRGPDNDKVNGKYSNSAGANGKLTQEECAAACDAESECIGYAHSTAWCVVYGPGIDKNRIDSNKWTADTHAATTFGEATKPNAAYICAFKSPEVGDDSVEQEASFAWTKIPSLLGWVLCTGLIAHLACML
jgi:hypothetical protein